MLVKIFLCEEHHEKLKKSGSVKGSSRVEGYTGFCLVSRCVQDIAWAVNVRFPENNLVKKKSD